MLNVFTIHPYLRFPAKDTFRIIEGVFKGEGGERFSMTIVFVDNRTILQLNKQYLHHYYVTDVLVFSYLDTTDVDAELYINLDRAKKQASEYRIRYSEEVCRLLIHGVLHVLGYRDKLKKDQKEMKIKEDLYLLKLAREKKEKHV